MPDADEFWKQPRRLRPKTYCMRSCYFQHHIRGVSGEIPVILQVNVLGMGDVQCLGFSSAITRVGLDLVSQA